MEPDDIQMCEVCGERQARHFVTRPPEGTQELCEVCHERLGQPMERELMRHFQRVLRDGRCRYCGGEAKGGCLGWSSFEGYDERNLWCEVCRLDLVEFLSRPENRVPKYPFGGDEAARGEVMRQLAEMEARKEAFMRERVRGRG